MLSLPPVIDVLGNEVNITTARKKKKKKEEKTSTTVDRENQKPKPNKPKTTNLPELTFLVTVIVNQELTFLVTVIVNQLND